MWCIKKINARLIQWSKHVWPHLMSFRPVLVPMPSHLSYRLTILSLLIHPLSLPLHSAYLTHHLFLFLLPILHFHIYCCYFTPGGFTERVQHFSQLSTHKYSQEFVGTHDQTESFHTHNNHVLTSCSLWLIWNQWSILQPTSHPEHPNIVSKYRLVYRHTHSVLCIKGTAENTLNNHNNGQLYCQFSWLTSLLWLKPLRLTGQHLPIPQNWETNKCLTSEHFSEKE